jgi:hypothetical protein
MAIYMSFCNFNNVDSNSLLLRELLSYSVVWSGIVPEPMVWKLYLTSHLILEVNSPSFILSNLVIFRSRATYFRLSVVLGVYHIYKITKH